MDNNEQIKSKTISGFFWRFAERCGAQVVSLVVSIVLARLLEPTDYGIISMVAIFITISQVFVDSGMGSALVQKKDAGDLEFSSVFYFNIVMCAGIYGILFVTAPIIAKFYENEQLTSVIRVLSLTVVISSLKNVQQAYVSKKMLFKRFFFATLGGTIMAAVIGIYMAFKGYGVWALVAQQLTNSIIDTIILWITVKWRPKKMFSFKKLKELFSFGWKLLVSSVLHSVYGNLRELIIGKLYSSADLAYYNKGTQFPNLIVSNINSSIDSVLLPAMSQEQKNVEKVKKMTRRAIKTSSYIMWPLMLGLAVVAKPLVNLLLTEKWSQTVIFLQIFCLVYVFEPIQTANLNAIKALGRSDIFLKLEVVKKIMGIIILLCTMNFGVLAIALGMLFYTVFVASIMNSFPNKKLLNYGYIEQIKDILPAIFLAIFMVIIIYPISYLALNDISILILQIVIGGVVYVLGSKLFELETFNYIVGILKNKLERK